MTLDKSHPKYQGTDAGSKILLCNPAGGNGANPVLAETGSSADFPLHAPSASLPHCSARNICKIKTLSQVFILGHFALVCVGFRFHGTEQGVKRGTILTTHPAWDALKTFPLQKIAFALNCQRNQLFLFPRQ